MIEIKYMQMADIEKRDVYFRNNFNTSFIYFHATIRKHLSLFKIDSLMTKKKVAIHDRIALKSAVRFCQL